MKMRNLRDLRVQTGRNVLVKVAGTSFMVDTIAMKEIPPIAERRVDKNSRINQALAEAEASRKNGKWIQTIQTKAHLSISSVLCR